MKLESYPTREHGPKAQVDVEANYASFVPTAFVQDPFGYFEREGLNIKKGEILYDGEGRVREDPTATKYLPDWQNAEGQKLAVVGKKINPTKGKLQESGNPFHEYEILEIAQEFKLPAARPVAKARTETEYLMVMTRIPGFTWEELRTEVQKRQLSPEKRAELMAQISRLIDDLSRQYEAIGLKRKFGEKDLVFDIDLEKSLINKAIPVDWERTKIDSEALERSRLHEGLSQKGLPDVIVE